MLNNSFLRVPRVIHGRGVSMAHMTPDARYGTHDDTVAYIMQVQRAAELQDELDDLMHFVSTLSYYLTRGLTTGNEHRITVHRSVHSDVLSHHITMANDIMHQELYEPRIHDPTANVLLHYVQASIQHFGKCIFSVATAEMHQQLMGKHYRPQQRKLRDMLYSETVRAVHADELYKNRITIAQREQSAAEQLYVVMLMGTQILMADDLLPLGFHKFGEATVAVNTTYRATSRAVTTALWVHMARALRRLHYDHTASDTPFAWSHPVQMTHMVEFLSNVSELDHSFALTEHSWERLEARYLVPWTFHNYVREQAQGRYLSDTHIHKLQREWREYYGMPMYSYYESDDPMHPATSEPFFSDDKFPKA